VSRRRGRGRRHRFPRPSGILWAMRRTLAVVAAVSLLALMPAASAASSVVNVSKRLGNQAEAAVAVDPRNPEDVVVASNLDRGTGIFVARSHDGGQTWRRTVLADGDAFGHACCDPTVTWDRHGNVFVGWLGFGPGGLQVTQLAIVWSQDGGDHWSLFDRVEALPGGRARDTVGVRVEEDERGDAIDQPTIASGRGGLWAIWFHAGRLEAAGARVRGLGDARGFGTPRVVPHTRGCTFGDIAVGPGGEVAQVCQRNIPGTTPRRSSLRVNVDRDGFGPKGFTDGEVVARTHVSLFEPIRPQRSRTVDAEAGLVWDTATSSPFRGRLYLIFTDEHPDQSDDTDVWFLRSGNQARTWSSREHIVDLPGSQFLPRIALDPTTGHLAVGFHDASADDGLGGAADTDDIANSDAMYSLVFSADGGDTWTGALGVAEGPSNADDADNEVDYGDYTGLAFVGGDAFPAWADNSNSTGDNPNGTLHRFDVYLSRVPEL
jgi:hypothetical protein